MPECIILSGIPTSGKSTYAKKVGLPTISCDKIREEIFGKHYQFSKQNEKLVWDTFYQLVNSQITSFIVDNTNCKQVYIDTIQEHLCPQLNWKISVVKFDIPLWKAYYRNIKRYMFTGKYIPVDVLKNMKKNYDRLWKK